MPYEDKVIEYLSKEIETHTNILITFRARINLVIFVGPFLLLGWLSVKGLPHSFNFNGLTVAALICLTMVYFTMGMACRTIEAQIWEQCNKWRALIVKVIKEGAEQISKEELHYEHRLTYGYVVVYSAMILAFACALLIISSLNFAPNP